MLLWQQLWRDINPKLRNHRSSEAKDMLNKRCGENPCIGLSSRRAQIFKALFMFKVTGSRSNVGCRSDHNVAQLDPEGNICAKFELLELPVNGYRNLARTK